MTSDVVRWTKKCYDNNDKSQIQRYRPPPTLQKFNSLSQVQTLVTRQPPAATVVKPLVVASSSVLSSSTIKSQQSFSKSSQCSVKNFLVIMSRIFFNSNSCNNNNSTTMTTTNRSSFLKFLTFLFVILQVNIFCSFFVSVVADELFDAPGARGHYTSTWAVHIPNGDESSKADRVAEEHGFVNLGKIFGDYYHFHHNKVSKRSLNPSHHHQKRLEDDERVQWSKQQRAKSRQKRDYIRMRPSRTSSQTMSLVNRVQLNDPKWPQMWYLNRGNGLDMNVIPAWEQGITGKGVVVTILDDGLESTHPDLEHNYDPKASYDVNNHDDDPMPHYDMTDSNRHGTRCAGEVAATANNSLCAVGIAFGANVGGVRMLDGDVTDAVEARSLSLNPQHIDIYSASWGPDDDGKTVDGPGELATHAFIDGVTKGRNGKGSIFIWASGNGGREQDNCNCDGYTNSIWTLSISSATEEGHVPWYSEKCSSTLATTYSSGGQSEKQVVTTDLHHSCTTSHTGTSASAPLAAGIVALVLEANRNLTWRDLQHIVVRTAKPGNLKDPTWSKNGVGRRISHSFGYGLMDAAAMVKLAKTWKTVPEQQLCEIKAPPLDQTIQPKHHITLQLSVKHCKGVNFLEHVQAKISLNSQRRGDIQIYLKSPAGTRVTLLTSRVHDVSRSGFNQWPFMSVHTWGESPHGNWQLEIHNEGRFIAQITQWSLIFYGTEPPAQPDDPIQIEPGHFSGELDNNYLENDPETMSGQWRDIPQIGESHVDIQRTTSNDQTSTACINYTPDQRCIECNPSTFLYNERCYNTCPEQTFMIPETPFNDQSHSNYYSHFVRRSESLQFTDLNDIIPRQRAIMLPKFQKRCASCHFTCLKCRGPNTTDCTGCHVGNQLTIVSSEESYCFPEPENSSGNNLSRATGQYSGDDEDDDRNSIMKDLYAFWLIIIPSISMIVLIVALAIVRRYYTWTCKRKDQYTYDRIAFDATSEEKEILKPVGDEDNDPRNTPSTSGTRNNLSSAISMSSSDSEDEIY